MKNRREKLFKSSSHLAWLALVLWLALSSVCLGQDGRLSVDLASSSPRVRSNAPVQLMLKTFWNGSSIVEGHFLMRYMSDGVTLHADCKSHDIVLTPGEQVIRLSLPSAGTSVSFGQDEIALKFVMPDSTVDLGRYPLVTSPSSRTTNVCVIGPTEDRKTTDAEAEVTDAMRLNSLLASDVRSRSLSTLYTRWDNVDVPEQAFLFCSFDLLVVRPEGLSDLRKRQMDALKTWVQAGGSMCVMLSDELKGTHVEFLNELLAERYESPFALATSGKFIPNSETAEDGIWTSHLELGRVAVVDLAETNSDLEVLWKDCRKMSAFLWRIRKSRVSRVLSQSRSAVERQRQGGSDYETTSNANGDDRTQLSWQPVRTMGQFINSLMPKDVKIVPMFLIAMVLLGYLILIGPVDYYVLGFFRRRRFTWITFPLVTAAVSMLCVGVSDAYLSSDKGGRTLTIRDIGADGSVLRETRFVMRFLSRKANVSTDVHNELFTPLDQDRLNMDAQYVAYQNPPQQNRKKVARYTGRMPNDYVVEQEIPQWTPQVNRFLAIAPQEKIDGFDWGDKSIITKSNHDKLSQLVGKKWLDATAMVFRGDERFSVLGDSVFEANSVYSYDPRYRNIPVQYRGQLMRDLDESSSKVSFMNSLCIRDAKGLFQFVSQISPNGGDNFEDLTVCDTTDDNQALLVIAFEEGDDLVICRRLYTDLND